MAGAFALFLWWSIVLHVGRAARLDSKRITNPKLVDEQNGHDQEHEEDEEKTLHDALGTSVALWEHMEVRDCLQTLRLSMPTWEARVQEIWELELKLTRLDFKTSFLGYLQGEVKARISAGEAQRKQAIRETAEELSSRKASLLNEGFYYDHKKEACLIDARPRLQHIQAEVSRELSDGCSGSCSKLSKVNNECREQSNVCPEGTHCSCHFSHRQHLAAAVGPIAYVAAWSALTYFVPGGALLPGPLEFSMVVSFLVASKSEGCHCAISPCAWDEERGVCAPKPVPGAKNPFQSVLPYLGQACVPQTTFWHTIPGLSDIISPGCEARPCMPKDSSAVGPVGDSTFNCQLKFGGRSKHNSTDVGAFPSKIDRLRNYMSQFSEELRKHMIKGAM